MSQGPTLRSLEGWAAQCGLPLDEFRIQQLRTHLDLLMLWNRRASLVSQTSADDITCKHFADSLFAASVCAGSDRIVDLGSGAGFPGLVIAIAISRASVSLVDSKRKKVSFLSEVISVAGVTNARAVEARFEVLARDSKHHGQYTVAISRALSSMVEFLTIAHLFLSTGGRAIAMKGPSYGEELMGLDPLRYGFAQPEITRYCLPDGSARALVEFGIAE